MRRHILITSALLLGTTLPVFAQTEPQPAQPPQAVVQGQGTVEVRPAEAADGGVELGDDGVDEADGGTEAEADEKVRWVRDHQIGPEQAIALLEQYWGRDLSEFDPEGPLPDVPPEVVESGVTRGAGFQFEKAEQLTRQWREEAAEKGQSILEFARVKSGARRGEFTGSYDAVADRLVEFARLGAIDGLNITPWLIPSGLDDIVDHLIPRLQERGVGSPDRLRRLRPPGCG